VFSPGALVGLALIAVYLTDKQTIAGFQNKIALELHLAKSFIAIHLLENSRALVYSKRYKLPKWLFMNVKDMQTALNAC